MRRVWLVPLIIILNVAVFALWHTGDAARQAFMEDNFVVSWNALMEGRYWTLLTSVFSHNLLIHILVNMFVLRSFGSLIEEVLGSYRFFKFYLAAGILGSIVHAAVSNYYLHSPDIGAVGASGAIAGLVVLFSLLYPREKILIFALIPVPAMLGAFLLVGLDLWGLTAQAHGGGLPIGHGAHLGGAAMGLLYYILVIPKRRRYV